MRGRFQVDPYVSHVAAWIGESGERFKPRREMAERFLNRLDSCAESFSFRTFSDTPYTRRPGRDPLERAIHGSLDRCWDSLVELNRAGAAVAVTVNQTNGRGRAIEDVRRVRALFLDDDGGGAPDRFELPPHLQVITSAGHDHYYWLVDDLEPDLFAPCQRHLALRYGGDRRVSALNQAMQLPGFWRRKQVLHPRMPKLMLLHHGAAYGSIELCRRLGIPMSG